MDRTSGLWERDKDTDDDKVLEKLARVFDNTVPSLTPQGQLSQKFVIPFFLAQ
jgi:uncharacterized protein YidB (DUF937 family)